MRRMKRNTGKLRSASKVFAPAVPTASSVRRVTRKKSRKTAPVDYPQRFNDMKPLFLPRWEYLRLKSLLDQKQTEEV